MSVRPAEPESEPALEPALALAPPTLAPTAMPASRLNFVLSVGRNERLRHEEASTAACELKPAWFSGFDYITGLPGAIGNVKITSLRNITTCMKSTHSLKTSQNLLKQMQSRLHSDGSDVH